MYDRLSRPTQVTVSGDSAATTSYTYSFTSPAWTDASGAYSAGVDAFGRETSLLDPIHGLTAWTSTYRADGQQATLAAPNGNTTAWTYDTSGRPTGMATTGAGSVNRASYTYTLNRAGQRLSELSTITGDPTNGTVSFAYDALGRLTGYSGSPVTSQAYAWDKVPNRTSKQIGGGAAVTMTYNAANRPTSDSAGGAYTNDLDGRLTGRPGQTMVWDALGRLLQVKDPITSANISTYTYDPLDRLASVANGAGLTKFRYVGATAQIAQARDGSFGTIAYNIGTGYAGEARMDFGTGGTNQRLYGLNGHHDLTWTAGSSGAVTATLRSDPWGIPGTASGGSLPDFRFQGSWYDTSSALSWAVTRWYAPALGRFVSEDKWLGEEQDPNTRHLLAYGAGEPVSRIDRDGRCYVSCVAQSDPFVRRDQWRAFFHRFPGADKRCYTVRFVTSCTWQKQSDYGRGAGMLGFMDYLIDSGRFRGSAWWNNVDRRLVQGSLFAEKYSDLNIRLGPIGGDPSYFWWVYIRAHLFSDGYHGGSRAQAWTAHQRGIWMGVLGERPSLGVEPFREKVFIWKVLNNLEWYYRLGYDADGALGVIRYFGKYPNTYPATAYAACNAAYQPDYAAYVSYYFKEPIGWRDYCEPFMDLTPMPIGPFLF